MRPSVHMRARPSLTATSIPTILLALGALLQPAFATPYPKDELHDAPQNGFLMDRSCNVYCGRANEHCCAEGEQCTTSNDIAGCATQAPVLARQVLVYTTTWTETDTFTSTVSSYAASSTVAGGSGGGGGSCTPVAGSGQIACGSICCASDQYCAYEGQCSANVGAGTTATETAGAATSWSVGTTTMTSAGKTITTQFSAPYRVTGTDATRTGTATLESGASSTASGNGTALATTSGSHLSGGAIAGIVVGTLLGVALLIGLCFCCIVRGLWHGLLALLGLGGAKKRRRSTDRETVIVEEERHYHHGGAGSHARRDTHGSWYSRPPQSAAAESRRTSEKPRKDSKQVGWMEAGAVGTLLALLGLRRDKKRREKSTTATTTKRSSRPSRPRSNVSSSYFSDSYTASSPSEYSSDYTYSSVYTPAPSQHHRGPRSASVVRHPSPHRGRSASGAGRFRDEYDYDLPPKSNLPPDHAGSASSGGRTRESRRSRRTDPRGSRATSRR